MNEDVRSFVQPSGLLFQDPALQPELSQGHSTRDLFRCTDDTRGRKNGFYKASRSCEPGSVSVRSNLCAKQISSCNFFGLPQLVIRIDVLVPDLRSSPSQGARFCF